MVSEYFQSDAVTRIRSGVSTIKVKDKYVANTSYLKSYRYTTGRPSWRFSPLLYHGSPHLVPPFASVNRLYAKLREDLLGKNLSETLTTVLEWDSALGMITKRATQMGMAFNAVRKFQFTKAARILTMKPPSAYKNMSRARAKALKLSPTSIWLEYWMGWAPLCGDIANAIEQIDKRPVERRSFSVGVPYKDVVNFRADSTYNAIREAKFMILERESMLSAYGKVEVTNHNFHLAARLGLVNPALTAWQMLPFSFLVDWFANIGQYIGALTDFAGLKFSDTGTAKRAYVFATATHIYQRMAPNYVPYSESALERGWKEELQRTPGPLPTPRLEIVPLNKLSLTRAATAVSLLTEIFLRK